jgi:alanine racemase
MVDEGDWPEAVWETADKVAAGKVPAGYADGMGCK